MCKGNYERIAFSFTSALPSNRHEESIGRPETSRATRKNIPIYHKIKILYTKKYKYCE